MGEERYVDTLIRAFERARDADDLYVEGVRAVGETIDQLFDLTFYELHGLELEHCSFVGTSMAKVSLYDCTLVGCDLSNANLDQAYFARTRLVDCKLEGAQMHKVFFRSTRLKDCMCRYVNLGEAKIEGSSLVGCDLRESFANEVRFARASRLEHCNLERADLFGTRLRDMDVSTCNIAGIMVGDNHLELRGMRISPHQAVDLVGLLGVKVLDGDE